MAISICSGRITWHRDHDTLALKIWREIEDARGDIIRQELAEIVPGTTTTFEDEGVKFTVEYPCLFE